MKKTFEAKVKLATEDGTIRFTIPKLISGQMNLKPDQIIKITVDNAI